MGIASLDRIGRAGRPSAGGEYHGMMAFGLTLIEPAGEDRVAYEEAL